MRDRGMQSGTELAREIQLTDWSTTGNLSNRSSGAQIHVSRDICARFGRYLYSTKCSWIISSGIARWGCRWRCIIKPIPMFAIKQMTRHINHKIKCIPFDLRSIPSHCQLVIMIFTIQIAALDLIDNTFR